MDMLYFDDMPIDWQLSMLNNTQDEENNVDLSLLNQISNEQNSKEVMDLKLTDNQLEHFLSTMDQPLVSPYHQEQINTTQNLNSLPTTSTIVPPQFLDIATTVPHTNNVLTELNYLQNLNDINNTAAVPLTSIKSETEIPVNYTNEQQLLQELLHSKLNSMPMNANLDYTSLLYNNNLLNESVHTFNMGGETTIGTKRKESIPDMSSVNPNATKKIKKISDTQAYVSPTAGDTPSTVAATATNLHTNPNIVMDLPVNDFTNNLQHTSPTTLNQNQILLQYLNGIKNKEVTGANATPATASAVNMNNILNTLIANSHQNMNSVMASQDTLNVNTIPATTAAASATQDIKSGFIPTLNTSVKTENDYLHLLQTAQQQKAEGTKEKQNTTQANFISPNLIHMSTLSPQVPTPSHEPIQTTSQPLQSARSVATTIPSPVDTMPIKTPTASNKPPLNKNVTKRGKEKTADATVLRKVKVEEPVTKKDTLVSGHDTSAKITSTSTSSSVSTSATNPPKYPLNASGSSSSSAPTATASNPNLNNVSWVKTQEKGEMKMAISRLKGNDPAVPVIPLQVIKHQKKVAHNAIERRYRNNINDRIKQLQDVIPALQYTKNIKEREKNQKEKGGGEDDVVKIDESLIIDGIPAARKLNKATVLKSATDYIVHLKKTSTNLKEENKRLLDFIKKMGGDEMVNQFTMENSDLYEDKDVQENSSSSSTTTKGKEKGKRKEKGKQGKQAKPVQEASPPHIYSSDSPSPTHINSPPSLSSASNEEDTTMLEVLSGERENQQHDINFNSNSTFTTMMVSLLLFSVGLFEYGSYLNNNTDSINQYENYSVGSQGKILLARSDEPLVKPVSHPSFYQYLKSKLVRMDEYIFIYFFFFLNKLSYI